MLDLIEDRPAVRLAERYGSLDGGELLAAVLADPLAGRIALVSSFGAESAVLLHLWAETDPSRPVIFLNTGKLFGSTLAYREALVERLGLEDVRDIRPDRTDLRRNDPTATLWQSDPDHCCYIRKTVPLDAALDGFDAWVTGRKRFQGGKRGALKAIETDLATGRVKINPLAPWSEERIARYLADHDLPVHPLVDDGYLSIGCEPCTRAVGPGEDPRAGRWSGLDKTECGIHGDGI